MEGKVSGVYGRIAEKKKERGYAKGGAGEGRYVHLGHVINPESFEYLYL